MRRTRAWWLLLLLPSGAMGQTCVAPGWLPTFAQRLNGYVPVAAPFDPDGPGPERERLVFVHRSIYVPNEPSRVMMLESGRVFDMMGGSIEPDLIKAFGVVREPGGTQVIYAAETPQSGPSRVLRWDGFEWQSLPTPPGAGRISGMCGFDLDGPGPEPERLYVTVSAPSSLFRWDGSAWADAVGGPIDAGDTTSMIAVDHPALRGIYIACTGVSGPDRTLAVYRWNGSLVSLASEAAPLPGYSVGSLCFMNAPQGPSVFAGGNMEFIGGALVRGLARWNGSTWSAADPNMGAAQVAALHALDPDGPGSAPEELYASGWLFNEPCVAVWRGPLGWGNLGQSNVSVVTSVENGAGGREVCVAGFFGLNNSQARGLAKRVGSSWVPVETTLSSPVRALVTVGAGGGPPGVYAAGTFVLNSLTPPGITRWNGGELIAVGPQTGGEVSALAQGEIGGGWSLFAGGSFSSVAGVPTIRIAGWDGVSWSALGQGLDGHVHALLVHDNRLIAGGSFAVAGGVLASRVAQWDGLAWNSMGSGLPSIVFSLATIQDDGGTSVFAGGTGVWKWTGVEWSLVASSANGSINAMVEYDDGSGPALFATGSFTQIGGVNANRIAKWDGNTWTPLGAGLSGTGRALKVLDVEFPGRRRQLLMVGGDFEVAGGIPCSRIASWYNGLWFNVNGGPNAAVHALSEYDWDGSGPMSPSLIAGGNFTGVGSTPSRYIAEWRGCSACYPNCDGSMVAPVLTANDFLCFLSKFSSGDPYANCDGSTAPPLLTANDFQCFLFAFSQGCN